MVHTSESLHLAADTRTKTEVCHQFYVLFHVIHGHLLANNGQSHIISTLHQHIYTFILITKLIRRFPSKEQKAISC